MGCGKIAVMVAGRPRTALEVRFWRKVRVGSVDECWPWLGWTNEKGYGVTGVYQGKNLPHRRVYAHRVALELSAGRGLLEAECACHSCDNPSCCNPAHLFVGDRAENNADMRGKCRHEHGERHHAARLSEDDVRAIRAARGRTQSELAEQYGVGQSVISRVLAGKAWSHV